MPGTLLGRIVVVALVVQVVDVFVAVGAQAPAGQAVSRNWTRMRSQNFVAVGDASARSLRRALEQLEAFRTVLSSLSSISLTSSQANQLVVFDNERAFNSVSPLDPSGRPSTNVGGYFIKGPDVNYLVTNNPDSLTTVFHEYTHWISHQSGGALPSWVDEGLAVFYSTFRLEADQRRATIGLAPGILGALRSGVLLPIRKLITEAGAYEFVNDENDVYTFYAQSWALVHYLTIGHGGTRDGQFDKYLVAVGQGQPSETAFGEAFGSVDKLHEEVRAYITRPTLGARQFTFPSLDLVKASAQEPMFEWEVEGLRADLQLRLGRSVDADKTIAEALRISPGNPTLQILLGTLRAGQGRSAEAITVLEPLAATHDGSFMAQASLAGALADAGRHDAAIRQFERAHRINPRWSESWLQLSISQIALGQRDAADASLREALAVDRDPALVRRRATAAWRLGDDSTVVQDTLAFVALTGFSTENAQYVSFMGMLSGKRAKAADAVKRLSAGLAMGVAPKGWPASVFAYLQGELTADAFLSRARNNGQRTEARAYIGLTLSIEGRDDEAQPHLMWVIERGEKNYVEYDLVRHELARLIREGRKREP